MNPQIEDLMYQAGLTAQGCWDELGAYEQEAIKKLAELIIRKCALQCNHNNDMDSILEYFGVEP